MTRVAGLGHALFVVAFFLPWVRGGFGQQGSLNGFAVARVALDAGALDSARDGMLLAASIGLFAAPALATGALAVLLLRPLLDLEPGPTHALAAAAALVPLLTVLIGGAGILLGLWGDRIAGIAPGLVVAGLGAAVALIGSLRAVRTA